MTIVVNVVLIGRVYWHIDWHRRFNLSMLVTVTTTIEERAAQRAATRELDALQTEFAAARGELRVRTMERDLMLEQLRVFQPKPFPVRTMCSVLGVAICFSTRPRHSRRHRRVCPRWKPNPKHNLMSMRTNARICWETNYSVQPGATMSVLHNPATSTGTRRVSTCVPFTLEPIASISPYAF